MIFISKLEKPLQWGAQKYLVLNVYHSILARTFTSGYFWKFQLWSLTSARRTTVVKMATDVRTVGVWRATPCVTASRSAESVRMKRLTSAEPSNAREVRTQARYFTLCATLHQGNHISAKTANIKAHLWWRNVVYNAHFLTDSRNKCSAKCYWYIHYVLVT